MRLTKSCLRSLVREAIGKVRIIPERPWSVEYEFTLKPGIASESEGRSADGFIISATGESGLVLDFIIDSYWNPQNGDQSGNAMKIQCDELGLKLETYVPVKFDDGRKQKLLISNAPVPGVITFSHAPDASSPPVVYLVVRNPFEVDEDIEFSERQMGNGRATVKMTGHVSL